MWLFLSNFSLYDDLWYYMHSNDEDISNINLPQLKMKNVKKVVREMHYGARDKDYIWFKYPHLLEFRQTLMVTAYCSVDFTDFPFDSHICKVSFGAALNSERYLILEPTEIKFKNKATSVKKDEGIIVDQDQIPFDVMLLGIESFTHLEDGYNYSYAGMEIQLDRNSLGQLSGGFFAPTAMFAILSLVSYTITLDMVS